MSLLSDEEKFSIVLASIRDYNEGENDIPILIVEQLTKQLIDSINHQIDTQDILDETIECYNFYNDFIEQKNINLKTIPEEWYELSEIYMNQAVKEVNNVEHI